MGAFFLCCNPVPVPESQQQLAHAPALLCARHKHFLERCGILDSDRPPPALLFLPSSLPFNPILTCESPESVQPGGALQRAETQMRLNQRLTSGPKRNTHFPALAGAPGKRSGGAPLHPQACVLSRQLAEPPVCLAVLLALETGEKHKTALVSRSGWSKGEGGGGHWEKMAPLCAKVAGVCRAWLTGYGLQGPGPSLPWVLWLPAGGFSGLEAAGRWRQLSGDAGEVPGPPRGSAGVEGRWGGLRKQAGQVWDVGLCLSRSDPPSLWSQNPFLVLKSHPASPQALRQACLCWLSAGRALSGVHPGVATGRAPIPILASVHPGGSDGRAHPSHPASVHPGGSDGAGSPRGSHGRSSPHPHPRECSPRAGRTASPRVAKRGQPHPLPWTGSPVPILMSATLWTAQWGWSSVSEFPSPLPPAALLGLLCSGPGNSDI